MNTTAIYIKTDPKIKKEAQKVAKELGFSLSSLLNAWMRQFIKSKTVTFSLAEEPSKYLKGAIRKAEKNWQEGKTSPVFDDAEDAIAWLHREAK
ncbi:hypothetical protein A3F00_01210 [Candidatus Daviesbacteria bacterium RIFCSPHIGHO2_12_FULL_37_11]|uniref:Uncharacterized protein n=1 Tax=Candidatus Daviesbacteria bacterium RIFCSPHIGHO2_12_FULL_37_11 TaxID=1797777 RepID=A0A1F5K9K1_9BACT|nr:MAG: hypothetical protein A3F00_01210 [Candidatus Daviesbacteria bacterium RIFCSPHIGHO2_12_FULL_37_11]